MHVVEHQRPGAACRRRARGTPWSRRRDGSSRLGLEGRRLGEVGEELPELGQHLGDVDGSRAQVGAQAFVVGLAKVGADALHPRPVRRRAAGFPAAAPSTFAPRCFAPLASSSARRLLPIPGSPASRKSRPRPASASSRPAWSSSSSRSRPTNGPAARRPAAAAARRRGCAFSTSSSDGSWRRIARSSSWSERPGSIPSSSTRVRRVSW